MIQEYKQKFYSIKLEASELLMIKKGLDFTFYII